MKSLIAPLLLLVLLSACNNKVETQDAKELLTVGRSELSLPTATPTPLPSLTASSSEPETASTASVSASPSVSASSSTPVIIPSVAQDPSPQVQPPAREDERKEELLKTRMEILFKLKMASSFKEKAPLASAYFSHFDTQLLSAQELSHEILVMIKSFQKQEEDEVIDALAFSLPEEMADTLKSNLPSEDEAFFNELMVTRLQVLARGAALILAGEKDFNFFEKIQISLFKWKPLYLKKDGKMNLEEILEAKRLLSLALKTKDSGVEFKGSAKKALKRMNKDLGENLALRDEIKNILELVEKLL